MYSQSFTNSENIIVNYQGNEDIETRTIKSLFIDNYCHIRIAAYGSLRCYIVTYDDGPDWEILRHYDYFFSTYEKAEEFFISKVESMTGQKFESIPQTTRTM